MNTFVDILRRMTFGPEEAPSSPVNNTQRRAHRRNPNLPRDGESFANYHRRTGGNMSAVEEYANGPRRGIAAADRALSERTAGIGQGARANAARDALRRHLGQAWMEAHNAPSPRLLDIPMGQHLLPDRDIEPGIAPATGFELHRDGRIGLISWGVDQRRSLGELFADVERVAGGPSGYLARLSGKESVNDINATPGTSSADGYFQIVDDTWSRWARDPAFQSAYGIAAMDEDELFEYRTDPRVDGAMAIEIARDTFAQMRRQGVERITEKHLYLGHFGGPNGVTMAVDQARGGFRHEHAYLYFKESEIRANEPVFFHPLRDAAGNIVYRTVERRGRTVRIQVGDRERPRTSQEVWERLTAPFLDQPVRFSPRASGLDGPLTQ